MSARLHSVSLAEGTAQKHSPPSLACCSSYGSSLDRAKSDSRLTAAQVQQPRAGRLGFVALLLKSGIWRDDVEVSFFFFNCTLCISSK